MYGLIVPPGVSVAVAEALEQFADYVPDGSGRAAEMLGYACDDMDTELRQFLMDDDGLSDTQIIAIVAKAVAIIKTVQQSAEADSEDANGRALQEFLTHELRR